MSGPIRIPSLGVDALPRHMDGDAIRFWRWSHPSNGITVTVAQETPRGLDDHCTSVSVEWRALRVRSERMSSLGDAWDDLMSSLMTYVPTLYRELVHLEGEEEIRQRCLRSQYEDERAEAMDEAENRA